MKKLSLRSNKLTGTLPACISSLTKLKSLSIDGNILTGSIPPSYASLDYFVLDPSVIGVNCKLQATLKCANDDLCYDPACRATTMKATTMITKSIMLTTINSEIVDIRCRWWECQDMKLDACNLQYCKNLQWLDLSNRNLKGTIPAILSSFKKLTLLDLSHNDLIGSIPNWGPQSAFASTLTYINVENNRLTGSVPPSLGFLKHLYTMNLANNMLNGPLDARLCSLNPPSGSLTSCDLSGQMDSESSGESPFDCLQTSINESCYNFLAVKCLPGMNKQTTYVTKCITTTLRSTTPQVTTPMISTMATTTTTVDVCTTLSSCHDKKIHECAFFWPENMCNFGTSLYLNDQQLSGTIPASWFSENLSRWSDLKILDFSNNEITGYVPPSLANVVSLEQVYLSSNLMRGTLPVQMLQQLASLQVLSVEQNQLAGVIPDAWTSLKSLTNVFLNSNAFTGQVPSSLCKLSSLSKYTCQLDQQIGAQFKCNQLCNDNCVTKGCTPLPTTTTTTTMKQTCALSDGFGQCTSVDDCLQYCQSDAMRHASLPESKIHGTIPSILGSFTSLTYIDLRDNFLTGIFLCILNVIG